MFNLFSEMLSEWIATVGISFSLITLAEIGDKSQLVCMTLAARYRGLPVLIGALGAFTLLNFVAVLFGAAISIWLPEQIIVLLVAILFFTFGIHALYAKKENNKTSEKTGHGILVTTFLLILIAELGDKTQLTVAGLSSAADATAVWLGATLALTMTSAFGVFAGRAVLQRIPIDLVHRVSGIIFITLGLFALTQVF